jgi:hypothetical protein
VNTLAALLAFLMVKQPSHFCVESSCPSKTCIVTVYQEQKLATIWNENNFLASYLSNPFIADAKGKWRFCALIGNYRIETGLPK